MIHSNLCESNLCDLCVSIHCVSKMYCPRSKAICVSNLCDLCVSNFSLRETIIALDTVTQEGSFENNQAVEIGRGFAAGLGRTRGFQNLHSSLFSSFFSAFPVILLVPCLICWLLVLILTCNLQAFPAFLPFPANLFFPCMMQ